MNIEILAHSRESIGYLVILAPLILEFKLKTSKFSDGFLLQISGQGLILEVAETLVVSPNNKRAYVQAVAEDARNLRCSEVDNKNFMINQIYIEMGRNALPNDQ